MGNLVLFGQNSNVENRFGSYSGNVMNINKSGIYYAATAATEKPSSVGGLLLVAWGSDKNSVRVFIPISNTNNHIYVRRITAGDDTGWEQAI